MASKSALAALLLLATLLFVFEATLLVDEANAIEWYPHEYTTYASISASPNPATLDQPVNISMQISPPPPLGPYNSTNILNNYTLEITKPDGNHEIKTGMVADATGQSFFIYTPTIIGNYTLTFKFPGQNVTVPAATVPGYDWFTREDIMLPSSNMTILAVYEPSSYGPQTPSPKQTESPSPSPNPTLTPSPSIPEFPTWIIPPFLLATILIVLLKRNKFRLNSKRIL